MIYRNGGCDIALLRKRECKLSIHQRVQKTQDWSQLLILEYMYWNACTRTQIYKYTTVDICRHLKKCPLSSNDTLTRYNISLQFLEFLLIWMANRFCQVVLLPKNYKKRKSSKSSPCFTQSSRDIIQYCSLIINPMRCIYFTDVIKRIAKCFHHQLSHVAIIMSLLER